MQYIFTSYEFLKKTFYTNKQKNITASGSFLFGAMSGSLAWLCIYLSDRIKTRVQANLGQKKKMMDIVRDIRNEGNLYKGSSWAFGRAILLHGGTFMTMEYLTCDNLFKNIFKREQ